MKKLLLFVFAFSSFTFAQDKFTRMDSLLNYLYENNKFMGSLTIREGENVVFNKAYGFADVEKNSKADRLTRYKIGSISKTFTAVMVMQLIEEKKLTLQTKLNRFYPKIQNAEKISIYDLLHHRTGIVDYVNQDASFHASLDKKHSKEDILKVIASYEPIFEPGSKYQYSNSNFFILGCIIEKLTKKSYEENLQNRIVKKAELGTYENKTEMTAKGAVTNKVFVPTTYYVEDATNTANKESYSYYFDGTNWMKSPENHNSIPFASGGITSTPADLTKFIHALFNGKLVSPTSLDQMKEIKEGYGKALIQFPFGERRFYGHGGKIENFSSMLGYYPTEKLSFSLISNGDNFEQNDIIIGILSIYYKMPFPFPKFMIMDKAELAKLIGTYVSKDLPLKITISEKKGELSAQATGQGAFPLTFKEEKTFVFAPAGIEMVFGDNSFVLIQSGMKINFTKE
ncbi:beta-lactamase family protein [Flavobacterium sp. HXWNR69]|uniref:Beta-lactamase family protein n=1 Tax=Flavobacterium fragile TaxID=2949085 RepID=A0ABT0TDC4_9FLAO|nr:serine hydrolase domain-containing protein [Flavobacterium sp. HXWNR69]MCL9768912.1 beta-lactamase family protein [Flavobacterium sp. HXWNR69]